MANYTTNKKATELDALTTLADDDVVVVGDTSDAGKAKKITKADLETTLGASGSKVKVDIDDTTSGFLDDKIEITSDDNSVAISKSILNPAGDEKIKYDLSVIGGGLSGSGGTKLAIDTTQIVVDNTGAYGETDLSPTINIPGGTLGTNNAIRFKVLASLVNFANIGAPNQINIRLKYGNQTLITATLAGSQLITNPTWIEGIIVADAATNAQKAQILMVGQSTVQADCLIDGYGEGTVDSTVDQNLVLTIDNSVSSPNGITTEGIIVEKIGDSISATSIIPEAAFPSNTIGTPTINVNTLLKAGLFVIPNDITATKVSIAIDTVNTAGTLKLALFSEDGQSRLFSVTTGTISSSSSISTTAISSVSIPKGRYYFAVLPVGTADIIVKSLTVSTGARGLTDSPSSVIYSGDTTVAASTMPSTINPGTLTPENSGALYFRLDA